MRCRLLLPLVALFALAACILVDDYGTAWDEAKPDMCVGKIAQSLYYGEFNRDPADLKIDNIARAITIDNHNYLLLKQQPSDKGGRLYRFEVTNGIFVRYRLAPTKRADFKRDYPNAPVTLNRDTVTVKDLGPEVRKLLIEIAGKPDYWEVEDKTLYNTMRNPTCRFEDRDLTTIDEPVRKRKNVKN